jgi:hypothetical protein
MIMSEEKEPNREINVIFITSGRPLPYQDGREYLEHHGKWLIYAPESEILDMGGILIREKLLEDQRITSAKYTTKPAFDVPEGRQLGVDYALMVYCDDRERESVRTLLSESFGTGEMYWKYDRDTLREMRDKGEHIPEQFRDLLDQLD